MMLLRANTIDPGSTTSIAAAMAQESRRARPVRAENANPASVPCVVTSETAAHSTPRVALAATITAVSAFVVSNTSRPAVTCAVKFGLGGR